MPMSMPVEVLPDQIQHCRVRAAIRYNCVIHTDMRLNSCLCAAGAGTLLSPAMGPQVITRAPCSSLPCTLMTHTE